MKIFDAEGRQIDHFLLDSGEVQLDYQLKDKGFYYFTISNSNALSFLILSNVKGKS
jgi:hypothetical protein